MIKAKTPRSRSGEQSVPVFLSAGVPRKSNSRLYNIVVYLFWEFFVSLRLCVCVCVNKLISRFRAVLIQLRVCERESVSSVWAVFLSV